MKINDIGKVVTGKTPSTAQSEYFGGDIPFFTPSDIAKGFLLNTSDRTLTEEGLQSISNNSIQGTSILVGCIGSDMGNVAFTEDRCATNQQINAITEIKENQNPYYWYYRLSLMKDYFQSIAGSTATPILAKSVFENIELGDAPLKKEQDSITNILIAIDKKIALNNSITQKIEQIAKQIFEYWFLQYNFPDDNGKPYKSSGGLMAYNTLIKKDIPHGWDVSSLDSLIAQRKSGDWGEEIEFDNSVRVTCVRGADIIGLDDLPVRYISESHTDRLLAPGDIMIEVSGGSPTQATGRVALITEGVIKRNLGRVVCSNFCLAFILKDIRYSEYLYQLWSSIYNSGNMFHYEGKTSGIKNFQTDSFLNENWCFPPHNILLKFHEIVEPLYKKHDSCKEENVILRRLRNELLPLLINGQVKIYNQR